MGVMPLLLKSVPPVMPLILKCVTSVPFVRVRLMTMAPESVSSRVVMFATCGRVANRRHGDRASRGTRAAATDVPFLESSTTKKLPAALLLADGRNWNPACP